jgi:hypothetical protein
VTAAPEPAAPSPAAPAAPSAPAAPAASASPTPTSAATAASATAAFFGAEIGGWKLRDRLGREDVGNDLRFGRGRQNHAADAGEQTSEKRATVHGSLRVACWPDAVVTVSDAVEFQWLAIPDQRRNKKAATGRFYSGDEEVGATSSVIRQT